MTAQAVGLADCGDGPRRGYGPVEDLGVAGVLAAVEEALADEHRAQVRALELDLQFAVLHSFDPQAGRRPRPALKDLRASGMSLDAWERAGNKLVQLGGDGTPMVQDLPICELAIARRRHESAARNHLADALDLGFRLPRVWQGLTEGRGVVWVVRKIARMSRHLDRHQVMEVDVAVARALDEAPGRVLKIAEATIIGADPEHAKGVEDEKRRRRCLVLGRLDEDGLRTVFGRIDAGDAEWIDAMIDRVADALQARPDLICDMVARTTEAGESSYARDELRSEAFCWLAHPEDVIALLNGSYPVGDPVRDAADAAVAASKVRTDDAHDTQATDEAPAPQRRRPSRHQAEVFVHLSQTAVESYLSAQTTDLVGRVEGLGPMLVDQLRRLLSHAHISLKPVIDLNENRSVNGYEHPPDVSERGYLRLAGDTFPHAQNQSRHLDDDHPKPYDPNGPPGQTGDHNQATLGRRSHRAKTFMGYQAHQIGLGRYVWRTPHGLYRLVDGTGTHVIDEATAKRLVGGEGH